MKITKLELKQIIKEELEQSLDEKQLDEAAQFLPMIMNALKNPQVQQMLLQIVMPLIQQAAAKGAEAPAAGSPTE